MEDLNEFRPIPGYEGLYSVNQNNQVKSHERIVNSGLGTRIEKEKILENRIFGKGYLFVQLHNNGIKKNFNISNLVALAWNLQKEPHQEVVKHLDNIPSHNVANNLQWDTHKQNCIDASNDKLYPCSKGENHKKVKLTNENVVDIRNSDLSNSELGKIYKVTTSSILKIKTYKTWTHI